MSDLSADLAGFLAKHVRPYDPATDNYDRSPFVDDIKSEGRSPYYNFHYYHTKVPPEVIAQLVRHYTRPGDVILDPFCGSGMTGLGSILADHLEEKDANSSLQRPVILGDLSPAACHISFNYNSPAHPERVVTAFAQLQIELDAFERSLYHTEHYEPAIGAYAPQNPEVQARLDIPESTVATLLHTNVSQKWKLLSPLEVEARLGYPTTQNHSNDSSNESPQWIAIPAEITYMVWSDVFTCEGIATIEEPTGKVSKRGSNAGRPIVRKVKVARGCGRLINLWEVAVDSATGEVRDTFSCPHCGQPWTKLQLNRTHSEPVRVSYRFEGLKFSKRDIKQARFTRVRPASRIDLVHIAAIGNRSIPKAFRDEAIDVGREMMRHGLLKRGVTKISDFYTHRNLCALAILWERISAINDVPVRNKLQFCFTSQVMRASRLRRMRPFGPGEQLSGTLYIAAFTVETNVFHLFSHAVREYCDTFPLWMLKRPHPCSIRLGSAVDLKPIQDASVDFVFTDPPFGKNIFYADCAMLWENWLRKSTDETQEIVVNERRIGGDFKSVDQYGNLMREALREMYRVLKPGRFAIVEFNNSDGTVFAAVKRAISGAGFDIVGMFVFDKGVKTFKQLKGANEGEAVVDKDVIFTLSKPRSQNAESSKDVADLEGQIADVVRQHLGSLPKKILDEPGTYSDEHRTTATINSMLMNALIPMGVSVERLNLQFIERVCGRFFRKIGQRWYLRGEAVGGNGGKLLQEEVRVTDELSAIAWLRQQIASGPKLVGELKPLWMRGTGLLPAAVSQGLVLEHLLLENFWRDSESNRWREPTDEEREKMNDDRSLRVLHDSARLTDGTLDRAVSNVDVCVWIKVLFETCRELEDGGEAAAAEHLGFDKMEGYRLIVRLSQRLTPDGVEPGTLSAARKQASVAGGRLADVAGNTPAAVAKAAKVRRDDGQTMLNLGT